MRIIRNKYGGLTSNAEEIFKEIDIHVLDGLKEAAQYAAKIMRKNADKEGVSRPGGFPAKREGRLRKSIAYRINREEQSVKVGSKSGKIHLTEFGHGDGKERNKRPLIWPSMMQAEDGIVDILSKPYF